MQPLDLLIIALATWYLSYAISKSYGPFHVFELLRERLPLGGLTECIVCLSLWIGALFIAIYVIQPLAVQWFAVAGIAILLHRYTGGDHV